MNKFGIQIERIKKIQSPLPISIDKNFVMDVFYYNTPIYREILLKFIQFTEKYYVSRTPVHFRSRESRAGACSTPFKGVQQGLS